MKRIFSILLITALLVALMPLMSTVALAEEYATITSENGYGVRLREGPSKAYNPLGTFDVGTTVVVLQRGDEWSQLQIGSTVGWMMNKYLIFGVSGSTTGGASVGAANAVVVSDNGLRVWLRATPGGTRLFLNSPGTPVTVMAGDKEWCQVSINGTIGYMMTKYLAVEKVDPVDYELKSATINYYYPVVGDTLVVNLEPSSATVTYEWYVDGQLLGTEDTFEVLTRYANQTIKVKVTGTGNYYGSAVDTVYPVQINRGIKSVALSEKVPVVGETLEAVIQPSSAEVDYSWRVGGVHVSSEATYTPTEDDLGKLIQLKVTGINGFSGSAACTAENVVVSDKVVQYVELSNHYPVVGEVLTAEIYPSSADVNITWYADGEVVSVTGSYQTEELDLGKKIKVVVEGVEPYSGTATDISANVASATITGVSLTSSEVMTGDGEYIVANVAPSKATAYYYWYVDEDTLIAGPTLSSTLELTDALVKNYNLIGKQLWVSAVGTGVYTGSVVSDLSGELVTNKKVTEVAIDNLTPAVGDTLSVTLKPSNLNDVQNQLTYVWMVGTETKTGYNQPTYKVQESDVGKPIRVKVVGANGYTGEAYSTYTNDVLELSWLTDVYIYNKTTGENAAHYSPEAGHAVYAVVAPVGANGVYTGNYSQNSDGFINNGYNDDFVTYTWSVAGYSFQGDGFVVPEEFAGERITVTAKPKAGSAYYYSGYDYSVSATSQPIVKREAMNAVVTLAAPVVGITPDYDPGVYVAEGYHDANVSVTWTADGYNPAVLDAYGCYLPGTAYTAVLKVTPEDDDVTLYGATVNVYDHSTGASYAATQIEEGSSLFYVQFGSTGDTTVNDLYIADLDAPVVGGELDTECGNDQVVGNVTWSYADDKYTACIELKTYIGYTLNGLEDNVFHVAGATETKYTAGTNIIWATFEIDHELSIQSDKDFVYLDGYNRRIIQCSAHLSNYIGKLENIKWEIVDAKVDGTSINNNGQLIIGMYEETERTLTVRATVIVDGKEYVAEKAVQIFSGTDTDTALQVVFTKYNSEITRGGRGYFEAVVSNSSDGCTLFAIYEDGTSAPITDGWLYVPASMKDEYIIVKGISNEDHSVACTMLVTLTGEITDPSTDLTAPKVEFTKAYAFVERGSSVTYEAKTYGTLNDDTVIYVTWANGTMEVLKNGVLTIGSKSTDEELTITAYSTDDPMLSTSMKVMVVEKNDISFTKSATQLERGRTYQFEAKMNGSNLLCDLYADFGSGNVKIPAGQLAVDSLEPASKVTITAVCPGVENVRTSMTANIYDARKIEFTQSMPSVSKGGYAYTFAAKATVFGKQYDAEIYADFGTGDTRLNAGKLVVADSVTVPTAKVTAKYTCADGEVITTSMDVAITDKGYIEFVSGPATIGHGETAAYAAVAYLYDEMKDCEIYAIWPNGVEEKLNGGKLKVSETELRGTVTIKAVYDLGKPTEMSATRTVTILPEVKVEFDAGMKTALKRNESAVYTAKAIFKNTTKAASVYADYGDGNGYVALSNGKLEASKAAKANVSLKAVYETVEPAYMTVAIKDLPTIKFTESKDKVEKDSTTQFAAVAVVDSEEYVVQALYADGVLLADGKLTIAADETKSQVTVKAVYQLDEETVLTSEKVVKIFDKASIQFTKAPAAIRGEEVIYAANAVVLGENYACDIYAAVGNGEYVKLEGGKLGLDKEETAESVSLKAVYGDLEPATITVEIKDPAPIKFTDDITEVEHGKTYTFSAKVEDKNCDIYVNDVKVNNGRYTVSQTEMAAELTVKAVYGDEFIEKTVTVKGASTIHIELTAPEEITKGQSGNVSAKVVFPKTSIDAHVTLSGSGATYSNGKLNVPADFEGSSITVTATYEDLETKTVTIQLKEAPREGVVFTKAPASGSTFEYGDALEFAAKAYYNGTETTTNVTFRYRANGGNWQEFGSNGSGTINNVNNGYWDQSANSDRDIEVQARYQTSNNWWGGNTYIYSDSLYYTLKGNNSSGGNTGWPWSLRGSEGDEAMTFSNEANGIMTLDLGDEDLDNIVIELEPETEVEDEPEIEEPAVEEETEDIVIELAPETEEPVVEEETAVEEPVVEEEPSAEEAAVEEEPETIVIEVETETEEPVVEEAAEPEVEEEPETIVIVVDTTEPVVEEEETEEVVTEEPAVEEETEEVATEEPAAEEETEEVVTEEPAAEEETEEVETEEPVVEEETEEPASEEPAVEEETEELTGVVLSIKDTITGEVIEEVVIEEEADEEEAEEEKPSKKDRKNRKNRKDKTAEEEAIVIEEDETLDALEGDDIGESVESESSIKISFTKRANKIKLGNYSTFEVAVSGSDQGVIWSLRLSEDVNGEPVSSIDQDGRVTISLDEKAEKLIVVATSREDRSVRARWIVEVTEGEDEEVITEEVTEETVVTEEETTEETAADETVTDEEAMAEAALAEENNVPEETVEETDEIEEELITVEEGGSLLDMF